MMWNGLKNDIICEVYRLNIREKRSELTAVGLSATLTTHTGLTGGSQLTGYSTSAAAAARDEDECSRGMLQKQHTQTLCY